MSVKPNPDTMTAHAFAEWSERRNERYELLDGVIVSMAAERLIHARTKLAVANALSRAISKANLLGEAMSP